MASTPGPLPWDVVTRGEAETVDLGRRLAVLLVPGMVLALHGELGAGKTCLVRGIAQGRGADPTEVHSPTFSLVHVYRNAAGHPVLHHVDLYRTDGDLDLREIGLEEILGAELPAAVEWAERLTPRYPPSPHDLSITLTILSPEERRIQVHRTTP